MNKPHIPYLQLLVGAAAVASLGLIAAACGGDDDDDTATLPTIASGGTTAPSATTAATTAPSATTAPAAVKVGTTSKGAALTDAASLTLYTFDNDKTAGKSVCNAACATTWPPLMATAAEPPKGITGASGTFTVITRDDGAKQIAYNDKPLYRYAADKAPGDVLGDGVGGIWHIASPAAAVAQAPAPVKVGTTSKGAVLQDTTGLSLYTFDNDTTAGKSSCNGGCATTWPPVVTTDAAPPKGVAGASDTFTIITRDDGTKQIAYNGKPLYRFAADKATGDVGGDGVGGVWHLAVPGAVTAATSVAGY